MLVVSTSCFALRAPQLNCLGHLHPANAHARNRLANQSHTHLANLQRIPPSSLAKNTLLGGTRRHICILHRKHRRSSHTMPSTRRHRSDRIPGGCGESTMCWKHGDGAEDEYRYRRIWTRFGPVHLDHPYAGVCEATSREKEKAWCLPDLLFWGTVS
jgi:hypothetical protein